MGNDAFQELADRFEVKCEVLYKLACNDLSAFMKANPGFVFTRTINHHQVYLGCGPHDTVKTYDSDLMKSIGDFVKNNLGFSKLRFEVMTFLSSSQPRIFVTHFDP